MVFQLYRMGYFWATWRERNSRVSLVRACFVAFDQLTNPFAEPLLSESGGATRIGRFREPQDGTSADLSPLLEDAMQLRKEVPLELVVNMCRKLVSSTSYCQLR